MYDAYKTKYRLIAFGEGGGQRSIGEYAREIAWEQNAKELATKLSFTVKDEMLDKGRISKIVKPGTLVSITAECGSYKGEVARGYVTSWRPVTGGKIDEFRVQAYDELYNLMKSQDSVYYQEGTTTSAIISDIFGTWGIPLASYNGPSVAHDKIVSTSKNLAELIYSVLDDAAKKGGAPALLRAEKGKVSVIRWGSNSDVWVFDAKNSVQAEYEISTADMVTRVKVIGEKNDDERSPVEAVVDGNTSFGIRQQVHRRGTDETEADAYAAAQDILAEKGKQKETITVRSPDVPFIQKGDRVICHVGYADGSYYVKGVRHSASNGTMIMDLTTKQSEN